MFKFLQGRGRERTVRAVEKTRKTWFSRVATIFDRPRLDDELWDQLEEVLISADVGVPTTQRLLDHLRLETKEQRITAPDQALQLLRDRMLEVLDVDGAADRLTVEKPPLVLLMVGVNGVGKTTSIAKLANAFKLEGRSVLFGAADTFRAAAIEQLQVWGKRLEIDVIAHQSGADPGAVCYDTLDAAKSRGTDVVIIDTAGRLHTRTNLMEELKKVWRVIERRGIGESSKVLLTIDATTGQNGLTQARAFTEAIRCDGVFLAKLDHTAKGGVVLAIADDLGLPVLYIGTGEQPDDFAAFDARDMVDALLGSATGP
ncbi:MAG: signal recognition particle-docking protein FtsY [Chloroflexi bacterium]|nr:signal recognition particle-docking protein FtsY [Chloroflexota bacterium]